MTVIHNLKLGVKLPLMLVTVGLAGLAIMGLGAYSDARRLLTTEAEDRLERTLESRAATLTDWSERIVDETQGLAALPTTGRAIREFSASWKRLGTDPGAYLRTLYLTENPHPAGERAKLEDAGDVTDYSILHRRYHPGLVADLERKGFLDVLLVDSAGRVVYSVTKADEFATDLKSGPYAGTPLAQLALAALKHKGERPLASDFLPDAAVPDGPVVIYLALPVFSGDGKTAGAVVAKIGVDRVSAVLATARGIGDTGQGYLVGPDGVMRSNLRLAQAPTILTLEAENAAVLAARQGAQGEVILTGQTGHPALASYRPLRLFDHDYAAVIEQDVSEFSEPAMRLARTLLLKASWLAALLAAVSWLLARSLAAPLERVGRAVRAIAGGDLAITVQGKDRGDEVGGIARALEELRGELSAAEEVRLNSLIQSTAFEACSASMMMVDRDFRISYTNAAFNKLVEKRLEDFRTVTADIEPGKLVGRSMDVFHGLPEVARNILSDPANLPYHADIVVGEARFGLDVSAIEIPGKGQFGFVVEWRDVTELRMNRALLNALDANQLICEFSTAGKVVRANGNLCACLDTTAEAMVGRDRSGLIEGVGACAGFWDRIGDFQPVLGRFELHRPDGGTVLVEGSVTPVPDRNNRMLKVVLIGADVTEVEARLQQARESAEQMQHQQRAVVDGLRIGLKRLSEGDLTTTIDQAFAADYEELRADFNRAVLTLAQAIQTVIDNATTIDGEAREISNAAEDLSHRTEQQAATLEQTAAALDELTSSVGSASSGAAEADRVVSEARSSAESSGQIVQQAVAAMGEIEESSTKISRIIGVIDDIAFQTNLLALNAGVEAARAGEAGRGFAVVASEVRALAQRSSEAAREIDALISASTQQVRRGVDLVGETGQALQGILVAVTDIAARVSDLAESSREQASGLAEINLAVNQLDQVTQQNAAMFEETTAASHALSQGARELNAATSRFRTPDVAASGAPARTSGGPGRAAPRAEPPPAAAVRSAAVGAPGRATALAQAPVDDSWEEF
ncbi:MAG: HAMP domain-containing protein [Sphingomonadales bacterium]|nr:HAMP domain-containing protein [Sphingomonadales bacterium]